MATEIRKAREWWLLRATGLSLVLHEEAVEPLRAIIADDNDQVELVHVVELLEDGDG